MSDAMSEYAMNIVRLLKDRGESVATAESCTGGLVASEIVSVPGASAVFRNGFITYAPEAKIHILGVKEETIRDHTVVSAQVASEMAEGCAKVGNAELSLAVTGLAGPDGGSEGQPVGLVFAGSSYHGIVRVKEFHFSGSRNEIRLQAAQETLALGLALLNEP